MRRKQITKSLIWEETYGVWLPSMKGKREKKYTETLILNSCLKGATLSVRANKADSNGSKENYLKVNMQKKKFWKNSYDNHNDLVISLPVGHDDKKFNQTSIKLESVMAGEEIRFEVYNPGPGEIYNIYIELTEDILEHHENSSSNVISMVKENDSINVSSRYQRTDPGGGAIRKITPSFFSKISKEIIDGQHMVKIPKFYINVEKDTPQEGYNDKKVWSISENQIEGFEVHPAFMKDGMELDQFWIGAYEASEECNKACSKKGVIPWAPTSFTEAKVACEARNSKLIKGFHMLTIYELAAIQLLCLMETGDPQVQLRIGEGNCNNSLIMKTGTTDAIWREISELWGNTMCLIDGIKTIYSGNNKFIYLYDEYGNGNYINTGISPCDSKGLISKMKEDSGLKFDFKKIFIPEDVSGTGITNSNYKNDIYYPPYNNTNKYWVHGSVAADSATRVGLFTLLANTVETYSGSNHRIGFRLAKV